MHFYSPRAYFFLREKFGRNLPDRSTIRSWVSNSTGYGQPGISGEGLSALARLAKNMKSKGSELYCSMCFDEMSIRRHVQWSDAEKRLIGMISYGEKDANGELQVAHQALAFLVTGINEKISIPIAYFFITSLSATGKAALIDEILRRLVQVGVKIVNLTFDGLNSNFTACRLLGASFALDNLQPFFKNRHDFCLKSTLRSMHAICSNLFEKFTARKQI